MAGTFPIFQMSGKAWFEQLSKIWTWSFGALQFCLLSDEMLVCAINWRKSTDDPKSATSGRSTTVTVDLQFSNQFPWKKGGFGRWTLPCPPLNPVLPSPPPDLQVFPSLELATIAWPPRTVNKGISTQGGKQWAWSPAPLLVWQTQSPPKITNVIIFKNWVSSVPFLPIQIRGQSEGWPPENASSSPSLEPRDGLTQQFLPSSEAACEVMFIRMFFYGSVSSHISLLLFCLKLCCLECFILVAVGIISLAAFSSSSSPAFSRKFPTQLETLPPVQHHNFWQAQVITGECLVHVDHLCPQSYKSQVWPFTRMWPSWGFTRWDHSEATPKSYLLCYFS